MTRYRKKGAPISAVTTPNFSSGPCEITLTSISAANVRFMPPSMLKGNKIPGRKSAMGLNKCGTTNPTKPMIPEIDTATPTANEIPITIVHLILWRLKPRLDATSSPSVSASVSYTHLTLPTKRIV